MLHGLCQRPLSVQVPKYLGMKLAKHTSAVGYLDLLGTCGASTGNKESFQESSVRPAPSFASGLLSSWTLPVYAVPADSSYVRCPCIAYELHI